MNTAILKPRICLIAPGLLPVPATQGGAIETLMTSLADENERQQRLDLTVVTPADTESNNRIVAYSHTHFISIPDASPVRRFEHRWRNALLRRISRSYKPSPSAFYDQALQSIRSEQFDALILEGGPANGIASFDRCFPSKIWYHLHYTPALEEPFNSSASRVLTVSNFAGKVWSENCATHQPVLTVYNGIDTSRFTRKINLQERQQIRRSVGFTDDDFVILYCGRIIKEKGVLELLKAVASINDSHVKLMIIGSSNFGPSQLTPYVAKVTSLADSLGKRVVYTGYIPNIQLVPYSKSADMQAIPSMCEEAAGLVGIEGMAAGLPLVVTHSGGLQEYVSSDCSIVIERDDNLIESLADAILTLRDDPSKRARMAQAGVERSRLFDTKAMYSQFVQACKPY